MQDTGELTSITFQRVYSFTSSAGESSVINSYHLLEIDDNYFYINERQQREPSSLLRVCPSPSVFVFVLFLLVCLFVDSFVCLFLSWYICFSLSFAQFLDCQFFVCFCFRFCLYVCLCFSFVCFFLVFNVFLSLLSCGCISQ